MKDYVPFSNYIVWWVCYDKTTRLDGKQHMWKASINQRNSKTPDVNYVIILVYVPVMGVIRYIMRVQN